MSHHPDLHVLAHSFPLRRSSDLPAIASGGEARLFRHVDLHDARVVHGQRDGPETKRLQHAAHLFDAGGDVVALPVAAAVAGEFNGSVFTHQHLLAALYLNYIDRQKSKYKGRSSFSCRAPEASCENYVEGPVFRGNDAITSAVDLQRRPSPLLMRQRDGGA